ncbi:hypothetical protein INT45_011109 [Circinella minor]|uniref:NAD(P)-binding protein n=1 Tax=Circinella minor TaxID=1195481 RepID=A0A8H7SFF8_9FUNG|nr:hypothetical protein INT45_011109 [Circinella minor]
MDSYTSKVAVITGASRGIGYNVAKALVERGSYVVIGDLLEKEGEAAVKEFNDRAGRQVAIYLHTDVTKYKDSIALFALAEKTFGGVDIAILNAGIAGRYSGGLFTPLDDREDMHIHEVNVGGVVKGNKVALLHMAKSGKGANNVKIHDSNIAAYCATKHAIVGWTKSLVGLQGVANIRANADVDNQFQQQYFETVPKTSMEYVVQSFLRCIEDTDLIGEVLLALPDGVQVQDKYILPECCFTPEFMEQAPIFTEAGEQLAKEKLAKAIKAANI